MPHTRSRRRSAAASPAPARLAALLACLLAALMAGCGNQPVPDEAPWFCAVQGADFDDALRLMQRRSDERTPNAARSVLSSAVWRGCWGNAALALGAVGDPKAEALLLAAIDTVAARAESDLEADALLAGLGLSVRLSDDPARIEAVVAALVERADPAWWHTRGAEDGAGSPAARRLRAETRARAALFGLAWSGTRRAGEALEKLRAAPPGPPMFEPTAADVFSAYIRQNRLYLRQPPGSVGR